MAKSREDSKFYPIPDNFYQFRIRLITISHYILFIICIFLLIIGILTNATYTIFMVIIVLYSGIIIILNLLKKFEFSVYLSIFGLNTIIFVQGYFLSSAYVLTTLSVILISTALVKDFKFVIIIFGIDLIGITILLVLKNLTIQQIIDPQSGIALVNNITVLIPILLVSFIIALIISQVYIETIKRQKKQHDLLIKTQNKLITQEKMESIQVLAGGIAHDFNNLLTIIIGNLDLLKGTESFTSEEREEVDEIGKASNQAKILTKQLLSFSKGEVLVREIINDLPELIHKIAKFSLHGRKSIVKIENKIENMYSFYGDRGQIGQIIQNLVLNADDAMVSGGEIKIIIKNIYLEKINEYRLNSGHYIQVEVKDTGTGIPKDKYSRIFDPFYTTKLSGNGLGLSVSYTIAKQHSGLLIFESEIGQGTTFTLFLPEYNPMK